MKTAHEIQMAIQKLAMERGDYDDNTPEFDAITEKMSGLKQTFVVLYNATTTSNSVACIRDGQVVVAD
jgi:hypothetical protein